jgi:hypothetical protein
MPPLIEKEPIRKRSGGAVEWCRSRIGYGIEGIA